MNVDAVDNSMTTAKTPLAVPSIYSPFSPHVHAHHKRIQRRSIKWAHAWQVGTSDLRARLAEQDIGIFAARVLPEADEEVVEILAEFIIWLFGVDDGMCEEGDLGRD